MELTYKDILAQQEAEAFFSVGDVVTVAGFADMWVVRNKMPLTLILVDPAEVGESHVHHS